MKKRERVMSLIQKEKTLRGFSLTELSAAIAIIAVIAGSAISMAITSDDAAKIQQTQSKLDSIEDTLGAYLAINKRLPCPSEPEWEGTPANFAVESAAGDPIVCGGTGGFTISGTNGDIRYGTLPVLTLQLPLEYYVDGWGRPFTYVVDTRFTNSPTTNTSCDGSGAAGDVANACFLYADSGDITVNDITATSRSEDVVVFVFSHGPNGHGAYFANGISGRFAASDGRGRSSGGTSEDEWQNTHLQNDGTATAMDEVFIQRPFIKGEAVTSEVFDDVTRYLTRSQLVKRTGATLYQAECVTAQAVLDASGANDCTDAANAPICEKFALEIDTICLQ